ncbi:alpha/beta hydrolase [Niabella pedocola]|uniref:Alpha/beta hydrolase n=1 Tax=Niabella pedocola TaxID=1752077 RepID=A0ABS8PY21_9BACT|nr:alpha/beta hydrolase [Niabella pedocola]MCD2425967.1 alpha/beta hydrolase [Niabella pedocola]
MGKVVRTSANRIPVFPAPPANATGVERPAVADHTYHYSPVKSLVSTGQEPFDKEAAPMFQGYILFCNGYLSDPVKNIGANINAIMDTNPDRDQWYVFKGANADEQNAASNEDVFTPGELDARIPPAQRQDPRQADRILQQQKGGFTRQNMGEALLKRAPSPVFSYGQAEWSWGYWNKKSNQYNGSNTYASYFNAQGNEYFINGSHGLGSDAAHRIDHGIVLGYRWAATSWGILDRKSFDAIRDETLKAFLKSYTPAYRPVTIVGHSQGSACAAGVVLGILNYASRQGWAQIPVNIIFLGSHQPVSLTGTEYQNLLWWKKRYLQVDKSVFAFLKKDPSKNTTSYINGLADLFNETYNKLQHEEGIYEHLKKITGDWDAYKSRAVQFDFTNDRGDPVTRCGDIPGVDSACDPQGDWSLLSFEVYPNRTDLEHTVSDIGSKKRIPVYDAGAVQLGDLFLPSFIANRRIEFNDWEEQVWTDYETLAKDYARSFLRYNRLKQYYHEKYGAVFDPYSGSTAVASLDATVHGLYAEKLEWVTTPLSRLYQRFFAPAADVPREEVQWMIGYHYIVALLEYAALQEADLYAHFSPVPLLTNKKILDDWKYERDTIGITTNIWERILKVGGKRFYRIEKENKQSDKWNRYLYKEIDFEADREAIDSLAEETGKFISTSVGYTEYIRGIIKQYNEQ